MANWQGNLLTLVDSSTQLYRSLVDLTCVRAGQPPEYSLEPDGRQRIAGSDLRALLRETAVALTVLGVEHISRAELAERVDFDDPGLGLDNAVKRGAKEHVLSSLLVSYYFKGGHPDAGCEFVHKSFREYLFAEAIAEALKGYARRVRAWNKSRGEKPEARLPPRKPYWQDFEGGIQPDPRHALSRRLAHLLAPQWLSNEVARHLWALLEWEVGRCNAARDKHTTRPAEPGDWSIIRDGIADLWDWWMEGVHLRPQPNRRPRGAIDYDRSLADELVGLWCLPLAAVTDPPVPVRSVTLDAHLGDGLFRLAAWTHELGAIAAGWDGRAWNHYDVFLHSTNAYQTIVRTGIDAEWVFFRPSGKEPQNFRNVRARINAAGWYPERIFPGGVRARGIDLRGAFADLCYFNRIDLTGAVLDGAGVEFSFFRDAQLAFASMRGIGLLGTSFPNVRAQEARVSFERYGSEGIENVRSELKRGGADVVGEVGDVGDVEITNATSTVVMRSKRGNTPRD